MIVFSLYSDDSKHDIEDYICQTDDLIDWLDENHWRYTSKTFTEGNVNLFVLLIDSKAKSQINYFVREFGLPRKNFKFMIGGHIPND